MFFGKIKEAIVWLWFLVIVYGMFAAMLTPPIGLFGIACCLSAFMIGGSANTDRLSIDCLSLKNVLPCIAIGAVIIYKLNQFSGDYLSLAIALIIATGFAYAVFIVLVWWKNFSTPNQCPIS